MTQTQPAAQPARPPPPPPRAPTFGELVDQLRDEVDALEALFPAEERDPHAAERRPQ